VLTEGASGAFAERRHGSEIKGFSAYTARDEAGAGRRFLRRESSGAGKSTAVTQRARECEIDMCIKGGDEAGLVRRKCEQPSEPIEKLLTLGMISRLTFIAASRLRGCSGNAAPRRRPGTTSRRIRGDGAVREVIE